ncbi:MAG: hypothetical protein LC804_27560 [Acidobacteria bacterium]|nr:hypothetical protein [Acidobacteriota bacterium]
MSRFRHLVIAVTGAGAIGVPTGAGDRIQVLPSVGGIPAHLAGAFDEPLSFQQSKSGDYFVFDRRAHSVFVIDAAATASRKILQIGFEEGKLLQPTAFELAADGSFVVADAPNGRERVQFFLESGARVGGFMLPGRTTARVTLGSLVLNGVGSLQYTGRSLFVNQPETGALVTEYSLSGSPARTFGSLRTTGQEDDREVHLGLNVGLPLVNPHGGFYFVFRSGVPLFRKYDARGQLVFERHIEGPELDEVVKAVPSTWPRRRGPGGDVPLILPNVRTAAVDPEGNLWIALNVAVTYVYSTHGEKRRTVQFRGAGLVSPTSLFFAPTGRLLVTPGLYEFRVR